MKSSPTIRTYYILLMSWNTAVPLYFWSFLQFYFPSFPFSLSFPEHDMHWKRAGTWSQTKTSFENPPRFRSPQDLWNISSKLHAVFSSTKKTMEIVQQSKSNMHALYFKNRFFTYEISPIYVWQRCWIQDAVGVSSWIWPVVFFCFVGGETSSGLVHI